MRASTNLLQLWRASKEDLGDCVVKAEKKKDDQSSKPNRHIPESRPYSKAQKVYWFALDLGLQDLGSQQDKHIGVAFVFIRKPIR